MQHFSESGKLILEPTLSILYFMYPGYVTNINAIYYDMAIAQKRGTNRATNLSLPVGF
jgi:hypothetical protein